MLLYITGNVGKETAPAEQVLPKRCKSNLNQNLGDWLTVHRSITLVDIQLDAQNSCLFTYNTFIKILYIFRGDYSVHRLKKKTVTCRQ